MLWPFYALDVEPFANFNFGIGFTTNQNIAAIYTIIADSKSF